MTEQEIKLELVKIFSNSKDCDVLDKCKHAYDFIMNGSPAPKVSPKVSSLDTVAVDLGLPSGTLWADRNLGAFCPEGYGDYFSWGDTDGHRPPSVKNDWGENEDVLIHDFTEERYKQTTGSRLTTDIDAKNDAATSYLGAPWRMPSKEDFRELFEHCDYTRVTRNGVNGLLLVSKNNGNSVFFPAAGLGGSTSLYDRGSDGYYWSRSWYSSDNGYSLYFLSSNVSPQDINLRYFGFSVRAVQYSPKQ